MSFREELKVLLTGDAKGLTKEMGKARAEVSGFSSGVKRMAGMLAGVFAVGSVTAYTKSLINTVGAQVDLAKRLEVTKSELDAVQLSFVTGGQSAEGAAKSLDIFNKQLGLLQNGRGAKAFEDLGLSAKSFQGLGIVESLNLVKKSLDGVDAKSRAAASAGIFGKGSFGIYEGLNGLEETDKMIKEINASLGLTDNDSIEKLGDDFDILSKKIELTATAVLGKLTPAIASVVEQAGKATLELGAMIGAVDEQRNAAGERVNDKGRVGGVVDTVAAGFLDKAGWLTEKLGLKGATASIENYRTTSGVGKSNEEVLASAENKRLLSAQGRPSPAGLAAGLPSGVPTGLQQAVAKADFEANKKAEEEAMKAAEEQAALAEVFGNMFKGLENVKVPELEKKEEQIEQRADDIFEAAPPLEPIERKALSEAGETSASGLAGIAAQAAIGGKVDEQKRMVSLQEQMVAALQAMQMALQSGISYG